MKLCYKLVRDNIPDLIFESGRTCTYKELGLGDELTSALADKLVEEALELRDAIKKIDKESTIEEMADLLEVLECIQDQCCIDNSIVAAKQFEKAYDCGSFKKGVYLNKIV